MFANQITVRVLYTLYIIYYIHLLYIPINTKQRPKFLYWARKIYLRISWGLIGFDFISRQMLFLVVLRRNLQFFDFE